MVSKRFVSRENIQSLVENTNIARLIGQYVKLKNQTNNLIGLCPFHQEKTPSFSVSPEKQFYHCFGCGVGGNAIDFLMRYHSLDFLGAVHALADFNGIQLQTETTQSKYDWAYDLNQKACDFFANQLALNPKAKSYLKGRKLSDETIQKFALGFAPEGWDGLKNHLLSPKNNQGDSSEAIKKNALALGLFSESKGNIFDKYRNRIIFPIRNPSAKVVGFGGRILAEGEPKYLNSPQSVIFSKSKELYGLYEMGKKYQLIEKVLVVEGYMDVIALFNYGIDYALATLGTAINENHLQNLSKITREVIFCFDGDQAGRNAAIKGLDAALSHLSESFNIQLLLLEDGEDPDTYIQKNSKQAFEEQISKSQNWAEFLINQQAKKYNLNLPVEKERLLSELKQIFQRIKKPAAKRIFLAYVSDILDSPIERVEEIINPNAIPNPFNSFNQFEPDYLSNPTQIANNNFDGNQSSNQNSHQLPVEINKRTKLRMLVLLFIYFPELLEKIRNLEGFAKLYGERIDKSEIKKVYQQISIYIQAEYLSEIDNPEMKHLLVVLNLIEENQSIKTGAIIEELRISSAYQSYFKPLIEARSKFLLDPMGDYDSINAANDFFDAINGLIQEHLKQQRLLKLKNSLT